MFAYDELRNALDGYISRTDAARALSAPALSEALNAKDFRSILREHSQQISALRAENDKVLATYFIPLFENTSLLTSDEVRFLEEFFDEIQDGAAMEFTDISLLFRIAERLFYDAKQKDDQEYLIRQIDAYIIACMGKMTQIKCIPDSREQWQPYLEKGIAVLDILFPMLEKEAFAKVESEECRELLVINSRYFCVIYDVPGLDNSTMELIIDRLIRSYDMASDPFYTDLVPHYDWFRHKVKCAEYLGQLTERNNELGLSKDQCVRILPYAMKLEEFYEQAPDRMNEIMSKFDVDIILTKAKYYAGEISREDFKEQYVRFYAERDGKSSDAYSIFTDFQLPNEYIGSLDRNNLTEKDIANIEMVYQGAIASSFKLPNKNARTAAIEYFSRMMECYIEVPGGLSFRECCVKFLAAIRPSLYIHAVSSAEIARCICGYLCENRPELFLGLFGCNSVMNILQCKEEIRAFAYYAALLHDMGKIPMIQFLEIVERSMFEDDAELIRLHTRVGAMLAKKAISTAPYEDIILYHNTSHSNRIDQGEEKAIVDIIIMSDRLDEMISGYESRGETGTIDDFISIVEKDVDDKFAPYLVELLYVPQVRRDLNFLLTDRRDAIFRNTYVMLNEVHDRGNL